MHRTIHGDPIPWGLELDVLIALWSVGQGTVEDVRAELEERYEYVGVYTTVLRTLQRMFKKGWVTRYSAEQPHIYMPQLSRAKTCSAILLRIRNELFEGDSNAMIEVLRDAGTQTPASELCILS